MELSLEVKTKTINDRPVTVKQFPAVYANRLLAQVIKYFGSGLFSLLVQLKDGSRSVFDFDVKEVSGIVNEFSSKLVPEEWQAFCLSCLAYSSVNEQKIDNEDSFNQVFSGKLLLMYKVLFFALEVNYGDFLGESGFGVTPKPQPKKTAK